MGIYKSYNQYLKKWQWKGFMFVKYYDTEKEADEDKHNVWEEHMRRLEGFRATTEILLSYR